MSTETDLGIPGLEAAVEIGRGGFAIVYRAEQPEFRRTVAVKVLTIELDERAKRRFERECQALGSLSDHHGIVTIFSAGYTGDGRPFLLMPFLAGGSYYDIMQQRGALPWPEVVDLGIRMSDALAAAHAEGILHRDLKPANILQSRHGQPMLADFGIARVAGTRHTTTQSTITGSVHYMAPELIDGQEPEIASDVYAMGATLYALLAGRPTFESDSDHSIVPVLNRIMTHVAPPLPGVPDAVNAVLAQAMAKDPQMRQPDALSLGRALQQAQAACGEAITPLAGSTSPTEDNGQVVAEAPVTADAAGTPDVPAAGLSVDDPGPVPATAAVPLSWVPQQPDAEPPPGSEGRSRGWVIGAGVTAVLVVTAVVAVVAVVLMGDRGAADYDLASARPSLADGVALDDLVGGIPDGEAAVEEDLPAGSAHAYTVTATRGQYLRVRAVSGSEDLDPVISLLDPEGNELSFDDDSGGGLNHHDPLVDWVFDQGGVHAVVVAGYSSDHTGSYELVSQLINPQGLSSSLLGTLFQPYQADVFALDVRPGASLTIVVRSEEFDTELELLTPSGELLQDDDGAGGTDSRIDVDDAEGGIHIIAVTAHDGEGTGMFTIEETQD